MYRRLLPLALATFAVGTDAFVIAGLLPEIARSLEVTIASAGQLITAFAVTYAIAAPVLGAATANLDRRTALLMALGIFVTGNVVTALGTTYPVVLGSRIISAMGAAIMTSIAMATATAIAPKERRGKALAIVTSGTTVATALGVPLGTLIGGTDWRITLWLVAGLGVIAIVGIAIGLPKISLPVTRLRDRLTPLRDRKVLGILLVTLFLLTSGYVLYTYIGLALFEATGGSAAALGAVLLGYGIGSILGNGLSGYLTDRYPPVRVLIAGMLVLVTILAATPLVAASLIATIVWAAMWGASGWLTGLPQQHRLVSRAPDSAPILLGLNASTLYLGVALGGGIGGLAIQKIEPVMLGLIAAGIAGLGLIVTLATTWGKTGATAEEPTPVSPRP